MGKRQRSVKRIISVPLFIVVRLTRFLLSCVIRNLKLPSLHVPAQDIQRDLARMGIKDLLKSLEGATIQVVGQFFVKPI
jgi:hypothetical protein